MGTVSYFYYFVHEPLSPIIEVFGLIVTVFAGCRGGYLSLPFMVGFYMLYAVYGAVLTITAFFQRIYTQKLKISGFDTVKVVVMCLIENIFFHFSCPLYVQRPF